MLIAPDFAVNYTNLSRAFKSRHWNPLKNIEDLMAQISTSYIDFHAERDTRIKRMVLGFQRPQFSGNSNNFFVEVYVRIDCFGQKIFHRFQWPECWKVKCGGQRQHLLSAGSVSGRTTGVQHLTGSNLFLSCDVTNVARVFCDLSLLRQCPDEGHVKPIYSL